MKKVNNFQIAKVQLQGCKFQPDVAYKSGAYKESVYPETD